MTERRRLFAGSDLAVFALALGLRLLHVHFVEARDPWARTPVIDEASYDRWAQRIASGEWIGKQVFFQDPLYPYALGSVYALFGRSLLAVRLLQAVLDAAACAAIGALARRLAGKTAGWISGALAAGYAPFLYFVGQIDKASFVVVASTAFLLAWTLAREGEGPARWFVAGGALGACSLLRGNFLAFVPVVLLLLLSELRRRAPRPVLSFAAGLLLLLGPVVLRNGIVGGEFVLTTAQAGTNFYIGNCARNPLGVSISLPFVRTTPEHEADDWRREAERREARALSRGEVSRYWGKEALRGIAADPGAAVLRFGRKAGIALNDYEVPDNHSFDYAREFLPTLRFLPVRFGLAIALGGAALLAGIRRRAFLPLAVFFAVYLATIVATVDADRIRIPLAVPLLVAAGTFIPWFAGARPRARLFGALGAAALFVQSQLPAFPSSEVERKRFVARLEHALLLAREGKADEAEAAARGILVRYRNDPNVSLLLAEIEMQRGMGERDPSGRERRFENAGRLVREQVLPGADLLEDRTLRHKGALALGWLALLRGRDEEAVERFSEALAFDPEDVDARNLKANALGNLRRFEEAQVELAQALRADPSRWLTWDTLAQLRLRQGDRPAAAEAAARVLALGGRPSPVLRPLLEPAAPTSRPGLSPGAPR